MNTKFHPTSSPANYILIVSMVLVAALTVCPAKAQVYELAPAPSPVDNPLKGLVPYARPAANRFPHSMEFSYLGLSQLMTGEDEFDWSPLEKLLDDIASRGNQAIIRIFLEYPGKKEGIPQFLIDGGLTVHRYKNTNTAPFPPTDVITPDYDNPALRAVLKSFIAEFGKRYDGDARLAYITAGLLGTWGEWHTYPRDDLWASKKAQAEVLDAYERAFHKTPVLLRYPAGPKHYNQTENAKRPFGHHDDSFAWATIDTGRKEDDWFYMPALKAAGKVAVDKWKKHPIGGEIRPEAWGKIFDDRSQWPEQAQDFHECVTQTHVSWLMDTGMFREQASGDRLARAEQEVRRMGYDLTISRVRFAVDAKSNKMAIALEIKNQGVAPFYADWPTEVVWLDSDNKIQLAQVAPKLSIQNILPEEKATILQDSVSLGELPAGEYQVLLRIVHPLPNGRPLRFANQTQDAHQPGYLTLGAVTIPNRTHD
jgi:Domain of unknown function (DUF4832)